MTISFFKSLGMEADSGNGRLRRAECPQRVRNGCHSYARRTCWDESTASVGLSFISNLYQGNQASNKASLKISFCKSFVVFLIKGIGQLNQCASNFYMYMSHLGVLWKCRPSFKRSEKGHPRFCLSNKLLGVADAAGPGTILWVARS